PPSAQDSDRERRLRELVIPGSGLYAFWTDSDGVVHERRSSTTSQASTVSGIAMNERTDERHLSRAWFPLSQKSLFEIAGAERVSFAEGWARQWNLDEAVWLVKWAVFALLWWDLCRYCSEAGCKRTCTAAKGSKEADALALVVNGEILRDLEDQ